MVDQLQSRQSIPQALLNAKGSAVANFLAEDHLEVATAFAAHPSPRHNVVGVGIGRKFIKGRPTAQHCVRFYVERKLSEATIPNDFMLPKKIANVPTDVVQTGRFWAFAPIPKERLFARPARPGCSIGFAFTGSESGNIMAGTFGAVVESDGKRFILSNNHVLANQNALPHGSPIFQPGLLDKNTPKSDQIAKLSKFVKLEVGTPNKVDCAIAELLKNDSVSPVVMPRVGKLKSGQPISAAEGMKVEKTGRTTGYTSGVIQDISADVKIQYELGVLIFSQQIIVVGGKQSFSEAGDSGSMIVDQKSKRPVGLLFGGSPSHTIANHIDDVLEQLKVSIVA